MEPERFISVRVSLDWLDVGGGAHEPCGFQSIFVESWTFEGAFALGRINGRVIKALGFDAIFSGCFLLPMTGAAAGGSDSITLDKSEPGCSTFVSPT
jgi:hypothetical protein